MIRRSHVVSAMKYVLLLGVAGSAFAHQPARQRGLGGGEPVQAGAQPAQPKHPPLFFSEEWKQTEAKQHPLTQENVSSPNLELMFYGSAKGTSTAGDGMELTGTNNGDEYNPVHIFTGTCLTACGAMFRDKNNYVDLNGLASIKWVTRESGFHELRPMIKLSDGTYLVGDHGSPREGVAGDYSENEFSIADVRWLKLDPKTLLPHSPNCNTPACTWVENPDLSKVDEVGFVDLEPGSGHGQGGFSSLGRFAVYGKAVARESAPKQGSSNK